MDCMTNPCPKTNAKSRGWRSLSLITTSARDDERTEQRRGRTHLCTKGTELYYKSVALSAYRHSNIWILSVFNSPQLNVIYVSVNNVMTVFEFERLFL